MSKLSSDIIVIRRNYMLEVFSFDTIRVASVSVLWSQLSGGK